MVTLDVRCDEVLLTCLWISSSCECVRTMACTLRSGQRSSRGPRWRLTTTPLPLKAVKAVKRVKVEREQKRKALLTGRIQWYVNFSLSDKKSVKKMSVWFVVFWFSYFFSFNVYQPTWCRFWLCKHYGGPWGGGRWRRRRRTCWRIWRPNHACTEGRKRVRACVCLRYEH